MLLIKIVRKYTLWVQVKYPFVPVTNILYCSYTRLREIARGACYFFFKEQVTPLSVFRNFSFVNTWIKSLHSLLMKTISPIT